MSWKQPYHRFEEQFFYHSPSLWVQVSFLPVCHLHSLKFFPLFLFRPGAMEEAPHNHSLGQNRCPCCPDLGSKQQIYSKIQIFLHLVKPCLSNFQVWQTSYQYVTYFPKFHSSGNLYYNQVYLAVEYWIKINSDKVLRHKIAIIKNYNNFPPFLLNIHWFNDVRNNELKIDLWLHEFWSK